MRSMRMTGLTSAQSRLLSYISEYSEREEHAPSFEQMKAAMGLASKSGIHRLIMSLEERGAIRRLPNRARAVEVVQQHGMSSDLERRIDRYCRWKGISRATFIQRAAEMQLVFGGVEQHQASGPQSARRAG